MLTIRAMSDGKGYSSRHLENSDYYAEGERVVGHWHGRGAELLGLNGQVKFEEFERCVVPKPASSSVSDRALIASVPMEPRSPMDAISTTSLSLLRSPFRSWLFRQLEGRIPRGENGSSKALVGIDLSNKIEFLDFAAPEHAHVLVAGVAGSGKS